MLIDDLGLHHDPRLAARIVPTLRAALPEVQWVITTSSTAVAVGAEDGAVLAIRRMSSRDPVEIYDGPLAVVH